MNHLPTAYRPDIDGLRAIAVSSVILFHFAPGVLSGGYLGVDLFFVLSGYLITQIIHGEIIAGRFTLRGFYERRLRRILPALLLVLAASSLVAVLILLPADLIRFAKWLLATLAFVPNVMAWRDTNYFSALAEQKPLLHTWSLGVEEQFYLLFPLLLVLVARYWPRLLLPVVIGITGASLALHALMLEYFSGPFAFFMLPTRAWEIGAGAIVALTPVTRASAPLARTAVAVLGLGMIAGALLSARPQSILPAVLAVAGTAILLGQRLPTPVSRLLGAAPLVGIGLISYSLYLWHWPVIVFSKYYLVRELRPAEIVAALLFMVTAAALSWRFVERPFRRREFPVRRVIAVAALGSMLLAASGFFLLQARGLPARLNPEAALMNEALETHFHCPRRDAIGIGRSRLCGLNLPSGNPADARLVLLGNSHAQMYAPVWREILAQRGETGLLASMTGCLPTVSANFDLGCLHQAQGRLEMVNELPNVRTVVLAMTWWHGPEELVDANGQPLDKQDRSALMKAIDDLIARLHARGKQVVLIGPIAVPRWNVASDAARQLAFGWPIDRPLALPRAEFERQYSAAFSHFTGRRDVAFARPDRILCDAESCKFVIDGRALFSDSNHLAAAETGRLREIFTETLQ
jgi:peptidoglycan/LPS O-acetylase OafA/YrhL